MEVGCKEACTGNCTAAVFMLKQLRKSNVRFSDFLFSHYRKKIHCCTDSSKKPSTEQYCETFVFNLNEPAVDGTLVHKLLRLLI